MPNVTRKCCYYQYALSERQAQALEEIACIKDRLLKDLIPEALDEYIKREESSWPKKEV